MTTEHLIAGINPLTISEIRYRKFKRVGKHPMYYRVLKNSKSWKGRLKGWWESQDDNWVFFNHVMPATVYLYGSNGEEIGYWSCKSNREAEEVCARLNAELNDFLGRLVGDVRNP